MASTTVVIAAALQDQIRAHAAREAPHEACGLLLGTAGVIHEIVAARNELASETRYQIDARDHFAAIRRARERTWTVVGAFHSHPASPAVPSPTDLAQAWPEFLYLIVSLVPGSEPCPLRGWMVEGGNFVEVSLVTPAEEVCDPPCVTRVPPSCSAS